MDNNFTGFKNGTLYNNGEIIVETSSKFSKQGSNDGQNSAESILNIIQQQSQNTNKESE